MTEPITDFTTVVPFWKPRVTPLELEKATEEQLEELIKAYLIKVSLSAGV